MLSFRVSADDDALVDEVVALLESEPPHLTVNRSDLLRRALRRGLEAIRQERQSPPKSRRPR